MACFSLPFGECPTCQLADRQPLVGAPAVRERGGAWR